jgi:hypothetical protein
MTIKVTPVKRVTDKDYEREHEFLLRLEELKTEFAESRGWTVDEDGEYYPYWWEDNDKLYAAECYAYEILAKEYPSQC